MTEDPVALCHLFVMVAPDAPERTALEEAGLRESFRREHPGQGTRNVCYCFDNAYLELLWVEDPVAVQSAAIRPTGLHLRADWRRSGASPFGVGLRRGHGDLPLPVWDFAPPYLPPGMTIPVAQASSDLRQPFVFLSPGATRPDQWTDGRAGQRQGAAQIAEIGAVELTVTAPPDPGLVDLLMAAGIHLRQGHEAALRMTLTGDAGAIQLTLPDFRISPVHLEQGRNRAG